MTTDERGRPAHPIFTPALRAYFTTRWRDTPFVEAVDDAIRQVLTGSLTRSDPARQIGLRTRVRDTAHETGLRAETAGSTARSREAADGVEPAAATDRELAASQAFDRAWAKVVMRAAVTQQARSARLLGAEAHKRAELLRLRFAEGKSIRVIAEAWQADLAQLDREYGTARLEFQDTLLRVVATYCPGTTEEVEAECVNLLSLLE